MNNNFINVLLRLLKEKNLTQKDLAKKLNLQEAVISHWINGKAEPSTKSINKLSKFFNLPVSYFFNETKDFNEEKNSKKIDDNNINFKLIIDLIEKQNKVIEQMNKKFETEIELINTKIGNK